MGLARSGLAHTSVLPQARIQRDPEPVLPAAQSTGTVGTLPLAPPGLAPENPPGAAPANRVVGPATTPVQSLPLAPVVSREGANDTPKSEDDTDVEMDDLVAGLGMDSSDDLSGAMGEGTDKVNLEELADQILPYIKRLMAIERERQDPA